MTIKELKFIFLIINQTPSIESMDKIKDLYWKELKEGDIITFDWFYTEDPIADIRRKFSNMKDWTDKQIKDMIHQPTFIVKKNEKGVLFGEGLDKKQRLYLHGFRFKYTKKLK